MIDLKIRSDVVDEEQDGNMINVDPVKTDIPISVLTGVTYSKRIIVLIVGHEIRYKFVSILFQNCKNIWPNPL